MTPLCPKCAEGDLLAVERRPNGDAHCSACGWSGPYRLCLPVHKPGEVDWSDRGQLTMTLYEGEAVQIGDDVFVAVKPREHGSWRVTVSAPRATRISRLGPYCPVDVPANAFRSMSSKKS